ncbi:MAG: rhodanese-like domain-containing protein [Anaerolineales bacterium]|nr:rhodanese-like domain-containing protein [Anaerolineales bacterium]
MTRKRSSRHSGRRRSRKTGLSALFTNPSVALGLLVILALIGGFLILSSQSNSGIISVSQAYEKYQQGAYFLDVREQDEWEASHIPNSNFVTLTELQRRLGEVPMDREIVLVCRTGNRSLEGRAMLLQAGFTDVYSMNGGVKAWYAAGYPWQGKAP